MARVSEEVSGGVEDGHNAALTRLQRAINEALDRPSGGFSADETKAAKGAIAEAITIMGSVDFDEAPLIEFTDSGTLTIQWERTDDGVLLSFSGDGVFGFSLKTGVGESYSGTYQEREVKNSLDSVTRIEIKRLSKSEDAGEAA